MDSSNDPKLLANKEDLSTVFLDYYNNHPSGDCMKLYDDVLKSNNPVIMVKLAKVYRRKYRNTQADREKALTLANKAMELGYAKAYYMVGVRHLNDDIVEAEKYLNKAADLGYHKALLKLGITFSGDLPGKAKKYLKRAVKTGNKDAFYFLGKLYCNEKGKEEKAMKTFVEHYKRNNNQLYVEDVADDEYVDSLKEMLDTAIESYMNLEHTNEKLQKENELLKAQLAYEPGGVGYIETATHFKTLIESKK